MTSGCLISRKAWCVVRIGSFYPKLKYFTDQNGPNGGPHQNKFWLFSNKKMNVTNSLSGKSRWKNWNHLPSFMFPSWVMVCNLSKKVHFLQFCSDLSKKSKSVGAIYIYVSESSHYTLLENVMIYRGLRHRSWNISN